MNRKFAFQAAKRCTAKSKRSGQECKAPAMKGWTVCRFHGAGGGAPRGVAHGMYRHGRYTSQAIDERGEVAELIALVRQTVSALKSN